MSNFIESNFPDWAICYVYYKDSSNMNEEDIQMVDEWMKKNNVTDIDVLDEEAHFSWNPAFGEACMTYSVNCTVK